MSQSVGRFNRFWTAEAIPRWFSLSLLAVLIAGMAGVGYLSARAGRQCASDPREVSRSQAIEMLGATLAALDRLESERTREILQAFAETYRAESVQIVDATGRVTASVPASLTGRVVLDDSDASGQAGSKAQLNDPVCGGGVCRTAFRMPFAPSENGTGGDGGETESKSGAATAHGRMFVEGVLAAPEAAAAGDPTMEPVLACLAAAGLFLLIYRLGRRRFQTMSRIAERIMDRADAMAVDVGQLRLSGSSDPLAKEWNQLVELLEDLCDQQRRSSASKELVRALEKSKRGELGDVLDVLPSGVMQVGEGGAVRYANPVARRLLGLAADAEGVSLWEGALSETGVAIRECLERAGGSASASSYCAASEMIESGDGKTTYRVRVIPFHPRSRRSDCIVLVTDISQQVRAEKASSDFVSQVTHELRTPLTNIRAYAETLSSGLLDDPKAVTDCYNVITKETRRLGRLIEDVLSMSQLEVGTIQLHIDDLDLRALLNESVRDLRGLADEKEVDMQVSLPSRLPPMKADREKMAVVINNLLGNALKYSNRGGEVRVGCQVTEDEVLITVKDDGIGIDPADHERIFEKFQRGSSSDVREIEGTGIGLTTAREIVRQHGGEIRVMSEPGQGATFVVHMPLVETSGVLSMTGR